MSRHSWTSHTLATSTHSARPTRGLREKILVDVGSLLALTGPIAAAVAALFSIIPATSIKIDPTMHTPAGPFTSARLVGLDHAGGDLRRAPRLTRRARRLGFGQPWTDGIVALSRQATYSVLVAAT